MQRRAKDGFWIWAAIHFGDLGETHRNHCGRAKDRTRRQVDTRSDNNLCHAKGDNANNGDLNNNNPQTLFVEDTVEAVA